MPINVNEIMADRLIAILDEDNRIPFELQVTIDALMETGKEDVACELLKARVVTEINNGNAIVAAGLQRFVTQGYEDESLNQAMYKEFSTIKDSVVASQNKAKQAGTSNQEAFSWIGTAQVIKGVAVTGGVVLSALVPGAGPAIAIGSTIAGGLTTGALAKGWHSKKDAKTETAFRTRAMAGVGGGIVSGTASTLGMTAAIASPLIVASTAGVGLIGVGAALGVTTYKSVVKLTKK
ncbi:MAG: hypothetical protein HOI53_05705 [Francisellaceae bacterium]|nr:hypothetical protein [Francisellaceae bacterium]MBT6207503.1 hypothetical protein [Francisellaceae bacterium]MBT6538874.1 hypothetical protein [Francisellaceae bacterium]